MVTSRHLLSKKLASAFFLDSSATTGKLCQDFGSSAVFWVFSLQNLRLQHEVIPSTSEKPPEISKQTAIGGSQKGGFQKGGFGGCSWTPTTGTRAQKTERWHNKPKREHKKTERRYNKPELGYKKQNDGTTNRNDGTRNGTTVQKTGTRAHSPKPPFYKTAPLFLGDGRNTVSKGTVSEKRTH